MLVLALLAALSLAAALPLPARPDYPGLAIKFETDFSAGLPPQLNVADGFVQTSCVPPRAAPPAAPRPPFTQSAPNPPPSPSRAPQGTRRSATAPPTSPSPTPS